MSGTVRRLSKNSLRLEEPIVRLAEMLARRYGVTVQFLIETLLLNCVQPEVQQAPAEAVTPMPPAVVAPPQRPHRRGRLILLDEARRKRQPARPADLQIRVESALRRAAHARAMAQAAREGAERARQHAREVTGAREWGAVTHPRSAQA